MKPTDQLSHAVHVFCNLKKISKKLKNSFSAYVHFHEEKNIYNFLKDNKNQILFDKNLISVKLFEHIKKYSHLGSLILKFQDHLNTPSPPLLVNKREEHEFFCILYDLNLAGHRIPSNYLS